MASLQMQYPVPDFLSPALIPELGADIAAGAAGHVHLVLIRVAALGAFPDQLAVVLHDLDLAVPTADLTIVALGVQLSVNDVVVDELHHFQHSGNVVLHIRHFHIADGAAGGEVLELGLEFQLVKGVDMLRYVDVVAVGDVPLVGDAGDDAEAALEAFGELVGGGFQRRAVQGVIDVFRLFPLGTLVVHLLHDGQGKGGGGGVCVAFAGHVLYTFVQSCIAQRDGGVAVVEELVNGLALFQTGQCAVLPQDGGRVGQSALQTVMAALEGAVAQLQTLLEDFPEFFQIAAGGQGHIRQVDGDHALIEPAVVLVLARLIVFGVGNVADAGVGEAVGGQERTAAHAGVHIALKLLHLLFGDVIRHHTAGRAFGGQLCEVPVRGVLRDVVVLQHIDQLGEGGGDPHAVLVLHALIPLEKHLLDDHGQILLLPLVTGFVEVHEHGDEGGLSVGGQQGDHLILDGLHAPADLLPQAGLHQLADLLLAGVHADGRHLRQDDAADLLAADLHEGGQVGQTDGLISVFRDNISAAICLNSS